MKYLKKLVFALIATSSVARAESIINYQTQGNLQITNNIACVDVSELKNMYTPADVFKGMTNCLDKKDYVAATNLYAFSRVYGMVDAKRVSDRTAHQAMVVLQMNAVRNLSSDELNSFSQVMKATLSTGSDSLNRLCKKIKTVGAPNYYPAYMIQHGMGAFMGGQNPIDQSVDVTKTFNEALTQSLHCNPE
ncbi:hypothetical protein DTO96_101174 [Ephemeroptericola cinctiostellae]|uniref:Uncharacterized protein n=1 Tax=Ephemeroptericola cinctiostellae TaxID=2268024 RepID=A0A345DAQ5_9BURK|nr:hypothetical protein [Ephemeroptericola cinctiostellae]AXF85443.1 hypothetical protein DTO96_101174 [Ephemeroptericola cinctiostellae]